jgi:glutaredoxin
VVGDFANLREMFAKSGSRTVPVIVIGDDVVVGFDRKRIDELLQAHGLG